MVLFPPYCRLLPRADKRFDRIAYLRLNSLFLPHFLSKNRFPLFGKCSIMAFAAIFCLFFIKAQSALAQQTPAISTDADVPSASDAGDTRNAGGAASGLPLPRFVSLRSGRVNVRIGPDRAVHAIAWTYTRQGLPVEIIEEYDNWRRIRDGDGDGGWVEQAFLSGKRTAMPAPWIESNTLVLRSRPNETAAIVAELAMGVIGEVRQCNGEWCELHIRADCDLIESSAQAKPSLVPQFLSNIFSLGFSSCSKNYSGWLPQSDLWGVYPNEKF